MLNIIPVVAKALTFAPIPGVLLGFLAGGLLGAVVGAIIIIIFVLAVIAIASVIAIRRLPVHLVVVPDREGPFVRVSGAWESPVVSGWASGSITANNFGKQDCRITGLHAEFRRLRWGVIPQTVNRISYRSFSEPYTEIDWLLPASGKPETREVMFDGNMIGKKAKPDDILDVRIIAEIGSPNRRVYIEFPERAEVRPPYVSGGH